MANKKETIELKGTAGAIAWIIGWLDQKAGPWAIATILLLIVLLSFGAYCGYKWFSLVDSYTQINVQTASTLKSMNDEMKDNRRALDSGLEMERDIHQRVKEIHEILK